MKFSKSRKNENTKQKEKELLEKFFKSFCAVNPNGTFKLYEKSPYFIFSSLGIKDLSSISLPIGAEFSKKPDFTANAYGFVVVKYKDKEFKIFAKGYESY